MEGITKPTKPYDVNNPKQLRRIKAYYKRLQERVDGNFALEADEKQDLVQIGLLLATHARQELQKAKLQAALDKALEQALYDKERAETEIAAIGEERKALLLRADLPRQEQLEELAKLQKAETLE